MNFIRFRSHLGAKVIISLITILPVILGGAIYILLRPAEPLFFEWIKKIGLGNWLYFLRERTLESTYGILASFIYSFPNGLWAFAYTFIIVIIWYDYNSRIKYFWLASIPILVFGFELLQSRHLVSGTFSIPDLVFGMAGIVTGYFTSVALNKLKENGNKN